MSAEEVRLPPHAGGVPLWNSVRWFVRPVAFTEALMRRHGDAFTVDLPGIGHVVVLNRPDEVHAVLRAPAGATHGGEGSEALSPLVGDDSVLRVDGSRHLRQRRLLLPALHGDRMRSYVPVVREVAERTIGAWPVGTPVATANGFARLTLEVICRTVIGVAPGPRLDALLDAVPKMMQAATPVMFAPALRRDLGPLSPGGRFARRRQRVDDLVREQVAEHRADPRLAERQDVLAALLQATDDDGAPVSEGELLDTMRTMLVAGYDTTALTLAWSVERLARMPEVCARIVDAIAVGDETYLDAVVAEVHRLRPTVTGPAPRLVKRPLDAGRWRLPEGVVVVPVAWNVHRAPDAWGPDATTFRPERWLGGSATPGAYVPFGGGVRRCPGAALANLETREVLKALLSTRTLAAVGPPERPARRAVMLRPAQDAVVVLGEREGSPAAAVVSAHAVPA